MGEANASVEEDMFLGSLMEIDSQQDTVLSESGNKVSTLLMFSRLYSDNKPVKFTRA